MHHSQRRFLTKSPLVNIMAEAATKAGRFLIKDFNEIDKLKVTKKSARDFVSNADTFSEKNIREELLKARPTFGFLMEESGEIKGEDPHHRWIVDPLDGTTNFLHGLPHFCISIAYERKGVVEAGVIYAPLTDEVFWAEKGSGAFLNFTRLRVSEQKDMDAVAIATGQTDNMAKPREYFGALRVTGSTALDLAYVAAGKYDGFFINHLKPWDIAAGMLLVQEAGGYVESFDGKTSPLESETLVTGSYHTFKVLRQLVRT